MQRKGKKNKIKKDREENHKKLLNTENKLRIPGGVLGGGMGLMGDGHQEGNCWVLYVSDESLNSIPETIITHMLINLDLN